MWRKTASQKLSSRPETGENHEPGSGEKWIVYEEARSEISFAKIRRRSVTTWDHIFSDHIFSDNIFSDFTGTHKVVKMDVSPVKNEVSPVKTEATTVKSESVVKEESSRPRKKARKGSYVSAEAPAADSDGFGMTKEHIERAFKDISDAISDGFGTCLREIKLLGDRMGAVEKKVGITKKGSSSNDLQLTTTSNPPKPVHEPGVSTKTSPKIAEKRVPRQSVRKSQN
ncbi:hypothetical protein F2Q69_00059742 [Brassica cretica]|uniref:Uncharacterized protein n=1 Tax=Brassica cretica TaxID=69181 RepID=A0A8S9RMC4_BRACR|nr:hypothetical protein F2Q69_00059742 [Brassica cretica]